MRLRLVAVALVLAAAALACQPTTVFLEIHNTSTRTIDFVYSENFIDLRDFGRDYNSLNVGDVDTYQGCTRCNLPPGDAFQMDAPLRRGQSVTFAARASDTKRLIFIRSHTWAELKDLDWQVLIEDLSQGAYLRPARP